MRVGVVGLKRGLHLADWCRRLGMEVVAACDRDPGCRAEAGGLLPDAVLTERWQDLLEHRLDGVILANDFDAHAPLAVAFLERGVHVLSETAACADAEEGRRLIEAVDASSATYSFAENYVLHPHVRLIGRALDAGELGRVNLVEADYLHGLPPEAVEELIGDPGHWRGRIAPTAYCTHTVSPVLALTGAWPVEVTAFSADEHDPRAAVVMAIRLSSGALAITRHGFLQGEPDSHWSWVSARGTRALAESVRGPAEEAWSVRIRSEAWANPDGRTREERRVPPPLLLPNTTTEPGTPSPRAVPAASTEHGSAVSRTDETVERDAEGTVLLLQAFQATVERGEPPLIPVRPAVAASLVGVAGAESLENGSRPVAMPGFFRDPTA
ncbi:Gfo/Idh/MocA family protein [Actinocorallia populi]|uniref:Gfo/Idh/MocA family protein n=1 Tax=Actinocorallia populi TaxID=2079200 RepID=UPI000D09011D|nr:Gfo/Idh/MocA family oxidoreductase [Actinocorallia populi]